MSVVYIAGPMSGLPEFNYPAFNDAEGRLLVAGHYPLNPTRIEEENTAGEPQAWDWYMRRALKMVTDADGMALLPGWADSRGARLERQVAMQLGITVRELAEWLEPHGMMSS